MRLARQVIALRGFLANRQQADARPGHTQADPRVDRPHVGELQQVSRAAFRGRADIQQHGRALPRRDGRRQCRTVDARQHPERGVCRDHTRPGVAGAEQRRGFARRHPPGSDTDRGFRLAAQGLDWRLGHVDHVWRVNHAHIQ